jgi:hypothetical protein
MTDPQEVTVNVPRPQSRAAQLIRGVNGVLRDSQIISKGAKFTGSFLGNDVADAIGDVIGQTGYGKKRRSKSRRGGVKKRPSHRRRGGMVMRRGGGKRGPHTRRMHGGSSAGDIFGVLGKVALAIPAGVFGGIQGVTGQLQQL